ncbi:hypothetical protein [Aestuariivivens sediminicola]|uniref:hypothetical protein n=1 Tax=Aestuariivivens sediminicola TaxID=2913560 RepID=UPI001F5770B9|nr:hypothetical protein [Aestuariivivens sediminicola]
MKINILTLLSIFICFNLFGQKKISGKIKDYNSGPAEVLVPTENPRIIGTVDKKGKFRITLENDLASDVTATQEKENAKSDGFRIKNSKVFEAFYCGSKDVETVNGEQEIETVGWGGSFFIGVLKEQKPVGKLALASSREFMDTYFDYGKKNFVPGYYINYMYVSEPASVKGICKTKSYTLDMKKTFDMIHNYDIDLKAGWNMVKIEVTEVYTDQDGRVRPLKYIMKTLDKLPKDVKFIFTPGDKL